jgi:hypothetical protein
MTDDPQGDQLTMGDASDSVIALGRGDHAEKHTHYHYVDRPDPGVPL